jgi:perosamine synthetase
MVKKRITFREKKYVLEVLNSQFRTSMGSMMTKNLEEKFAEKFQTRFAISFINGTATMHAALQAAGIGPGDEVIVPPLTMASTSFAVLHAGAIPVFADVDPKCWTIDPMAIEQCISKRTKAIIPVALYGLLPDYDRIMSLAEKYQLFVLEDDAQCFLGYYKGRIGGSIGHAASFSFQSSKQMTSGEGGMITTNDEELADNIRRFNSLGYSSVKAGAGEGKITKDVIQDPDYYRHGSIGWNYRMPELCAAVALGQLEHLEDLITMRKKVANAYTKAVKGCTWLQPQFVPDGYDHTYWTYVLKLDNGNNFNWYDFRKKYMDFGGDGIYGAWKLTYLEPAFKEKRFGPYQTQILKEGLCRNAEELQPKLLQFKTNYFNNKQIEVAANALRHTIEYFDSKELFF